MTLFRSVNSAQKPASNRIKKIKEGKIIGFKLLEILIFMYRARLSLEYTLIDHKNKKRKKSFRAQQRITTRKFIAAVLLRGSRTFYTRHWQFFKAEFPSKN